MIQDNLQNETEIRRFLLSEMSEEERNAFEEKFIADEDLFDQIRVGEDELIENYVRGILNSNEKEKFEKNFLTTKVRRERVVFTRVMLEKLVQPAAAAKKTEPAAAPLSAWASIIDFFKTPQYALASAFVVLIVALAGWFLMRNLNRPEAPVIVQQFTPTPTATITPDPPTDSNNQNSVIVTNANLPNKTETNKNTNIDNVNKNQNNKNSSEQLPPKPVIATLALFTGTVRSEGKTAELTLKKETTDANLQLNLESQDYQTYRTEIVDENGLVIYRSGKLKPNRSKLYTSIPTQKLQNGDYIVKVYGKNAGNRDESAADFTFRVIRK